MLSYKCIITDTIFPCTPGSRDRAEGLISIIPWKHHSTVRWCHYWNETVPLPFWRQEHRGSERLSLFEAACLKTAEPEIRPSLFDLKSLALHLLHVTQLQSSDKELLIMPERV